MRKYIIIFILSFTASLYLFEFYLLNFKSNNSNQIIKKRSDQEEKNKQKIKSLKKNIQTPLYVSQKIMSDPKYMDLVKKYKFYPIGLEPDSQIFLCNEGYGDLIIKTDHLGLRNSNDKWKYKKPEIVILGDSYSAGICVDHQHSIDGYFSNTFKTINLSTSGNQPIHYAYIIEQIISNLKPNYVLVNFYNGNDFESYSKAHEIKNLLNEKNYFRDKENNIIANKKSKQFFKDLKELKKEDYKKFLNNEKNIISKKNIRDFLFLSQTRHLFEKRFSIQIRKHSICYKNSCILGEFNQNGFDQAKFALNILLKKCNIKTNCVPIVSLIPHSSMNDPEYYNLLKIEFKTIIKSYKKKYPELIYFDSHKYINNKDMKFYAPSGGHLSKYGYETFSKELVKLIKKK